jgi:AcrR family transcriptional regulator
MPTQVLQKEDLNKDIITVSANLFRQFGFKKTTVEDIAKEIGRRKSSLYYYYKSKEEIFEAVVNEEMHRFFRQIKRSIAQSAGAKQKLLIYCRAKFQHLALLCNLNGVLKNEVHEIQCITNPLRHKFDTTQVALVREILQEGVATNEFKTMSGGEMDSFAYIIVSSFRGLESPLVLNKQEPDLNSRIESIVELMVEGIGKQHLTPSAS